MKIYATYNIKGGVGKTTAAVNLAHLSAAAGRRTLLWDLDPQGAASYIFRVKSRVKGGGQGLIRGTKTLDGAIKGTDFDDLDLLPADFTYRNMDLLLDAAGQAKAARKSNRKLAQLLAPLEADYDRVFLDCPPSISLVSENVMHAADVLLVPLIPTTLSVRTLDQLTEFIADFNGRHPDVRAFFSMVDRRKSLHLQITRDLRAERAGIAASAIPALSLIERMSTERAPVTAFAPRSTAARAYRDLWSEISKVSILDIRGILRVGGGLVAMVKTPVEIDEEALATAAEVLGTKTKKDTVNAALREVGARIERLRALARLGELADRGDFGEFLDNKAAYRR